MWRSMALISACARSIGTSGRSLPTASQLCPVRTVVPGSPNVAIGSHSSTCSGYAKPGDAAVVSLQSHIVGEVRPGFPSPLIKPSMRISRTGLSDWLHPTAHGRDTKVAPSDSTGIHLPSPFDIACSRNIRNHCG